VYKIGGGGGEKVKGVLETLGFWKERVRREQRTHADSDGEPLGVVYLEGKVQ
jgi:hypothetical protein